MNRTQILQDPDSGFGWVLFQRNELYLVQMLLQLKKNIMLSGICDVIYTLASIDFVAEPLYHFIHLALPSRVVTLGQE